MEILKFHELTVFFACFFAGICICAVFDMFRAIRRIKRFSDRAVAVQDIFFCFLACGILWAALYISRGTELRWYEPVGTVTGICIYCLFLSSFFMRFYAVLLNGLCKVIIFVISPVKIFVRWLKKLFSYIIRPIFALKCRILYILHKPMAKTDNKCREKIKNICKKFFFTFLKR